MIILTAKKLLLTLNNSTWIKCHYDNFDVPMGAYDSAQIADLVGIYILDILSRICKSQTNRPIQRWWTRVHTDSKGPLTLKIQKKIIRAFKLLGFRIEISSEPKIVDYLDITLNLTNNTFKLYHKDNETPTYINVNSNHFKTIVKQIPTTINTRISQWSSNVNIFNENVLQKSGFKNKSSYLIPINNTKTPGIKRRHRKRKTIWFNPTLLQIVKY